MNHSTANTLTEGGIRVHPSVVPVQRVEDLLRLLHLHVKEHGMPPSRELVWPHDPFMVLRTHALVEDLARHIVFALRPRGHLCRPHQFVYQLPDHVPPDYPLEFHVDVPPRGQRYTSIVGVALTEWNARNGSVHAVTRDNSIVAVELSPGDVFEMAPDVQHSPGLNMTGLPRIGMYVRWTERA